ncbi:hypothetical protein [Paenibacillus sp. SAFN-117]|uniref:hypothetical protein n=1 Tax=Paenibacillus sp. SAFN-117 TaxID=3436860 RepID=UPI003F7D9684
MKILEAVRFHFESFEPVSESDNKVLQKSQQRTKCSFGRIESGSAGRTVKVARAERLDRVRGEETSMFQRGKTALAKPMLQLSVEEKSTNLLKLQSFLMRQDDFSTHSHMMY